MLSLSWSDLFASSRIIDGRSYLAWTAIKRARCDVRMVGGGGSNLSLLPGIYDCLSAFWLAPGRSAMRRNGREIPTQRIQKKEGNPSSNATMNESPSLVWTLETGGGFFLWMNSRPQTTRRLQLLALRLTKCKISTFVGLLR